jgi:hypothetical protein
VRPTRPPPSVLGSSKPDGRGGTQTAWLRLPWALDWRREVERRWLVLTNLRISQGFDLSSVEPLCLRAGVTARMVADDVTAAAARDLSETEHVR